MQHTWTVTEDDHKTRLDVFLREHAGGTSRSALAKMIKAEQVKVNGKAASVHRFLKEGDIVSMDEASPKEMKQKEKRAKESLPPLRIKKETPEWLVIDKPRGVLVHPDSKTKSGTLVDLLVEHDPAIAKIGEDPSRPGIMHRLDREVSGLMVIAKTQDAFDHLKKQFAEHSVQKTYLALVYGKTVHDEGDIKFRIARSKKKARMAALPEHEKAGQVAWTHYKVVKRFQNATLLELEIYTGRTHQIRAHLFGLGHPIIGDPLYTPKHGTPRIDSPRLLLQAIRLSFIDPESGDSQTFTLNPDPAFEEVTASMTPLV